MPITTGDIYKHHEGDVYYIISTGISLDTYTDIIVYKIVGTPQYISTGDERQFLDKLSNGKNKYEFIANIKDLV